MSKAAVLIMITKENPSLRNALAMIDSFCSKAYKNANDGLYNNTYDFYFYYADPSLDCDYFEEIEPLQKFNIDLPNVHFIAVGDEESIYRTYEKTAKIFRFISNKEYDWIFRINCSLFLNIDLIDLALSNRWFETNKIYCNAINSIDIGEYKYMNTLYARGDMYIMSMKLLKRILPYLKKYEYCDTDMKQRIEVIHVDDVIMGLVVKDAIGKEYWKSFVSLNYLFFPDYDDFLINIHKFAKCISSRVKTIPPGTVYSGYSWDDNEYRKKDAEKMKYLDLLSNSISYESYKHFFNSINDIIDNDYNRGVVLTQRTSVPYKKMIDIIS